MKREGKLLCFGKGGHSIEFRRGHTLRGYDRPETFDDWDNVKEGCVVLDKRPAIETEAGYRWVFNGPLVDVDLPDDQVDRCPSIFGSVMAEAMMSEPGNQFGAIAALQMSSKASTGPLDSVSIKAYVQGWVDLGARQGVVKDRQIVWS